MYLQQPTATNPQGLSSQGSPETPPLEHPSEGDQPLDQCICPNVGTYWHLGKRKGSEQYVLASADGQHQYPVTVVEAYALRHFNGKYTVAHLQKYCQKTLKGNIPDDLVRQLLQKLMDWGIIAWMGEDTPQDDPPPPPPKSALKDCVQWLEHPEGYWILRNPEDVTFMQVNPQAKTIIEQLGAVPTEELVQRYNIPPDQLQLLLRQLTTTAMLEGTKPPTPPKRKFTPLRLLFFKVPLFNPDPYLEKPAQRLSWIWTKPFFLLWCGGMAWTTAAAFDERSHLLAFGQALLHHYGISLLLPFALLALFVVTLHELGHALTLKQYGGIVPEVGLLFMVLMPAAYTNTTDAYCLVKRRQRVLVVAAGVMVQFTIAAVAFWLWKGSVNNSWLSPVSFLLFFAALFTVAVNLNPMAKFDGYYLAVALTGINNLRSRSFGFYGDLLTLHPSQEKKRDQPILAAFAPLSLAYMIFVFGSILLLITHWTLDNIPTLAALLLLLWAIYYFFPEGSNS
ncbi:hypothetical protein PN462_18390 [Spirulina sp. CS-785/01]|uniref:site-2 protease family protein n=1 Tax=Spirulina sp. CS-785/01 TaxID=3021716 RepID=UPI002330CD17|nr:site-2 protease family protein [Spirulina sp. CS-785/01]MDB9315090.1 hypothetical protein [Spirulina sp. CS-785/01]